MMGTPASALSRMGGRGANIGLKVFRHSGLTEFTKFRTSLATLEHFIASWAAPPGLENSLWTCFGKLDHIPGRFGASAGPKYRRNPSPERNLSRVKILLT